MILPWNLEKLTVNGHLWDAVGDTCRQLPVVMSVSKASRDELAGCTEAEMGAIQPRNSTSGDMRHVRCEQEWKHRDSRRKITNNHATL